MLGKMLIECPLFVHLAYQCSFLFVCFIGLYAGHPYIHLTSGNLFTGVYVQCMSTWYTCESNSHGLSVSSVHFWPTIGIFTVAGVNLVHCCCWVWPSAFLSDSKLCIGWIDLWTNSRQHFFLSTNPFTKTRPEFDEGLTGCIRKQ